MFKNGKDKIPGEFAAYLSLSVFAPLAATWYFAGTVRPWRRSVILTSR